MSMIYEKIKKNDDERKAATPPTHGEALELAVEMINDARAKRGCSLDHGYILFVPDKYTLRAEKLLYNAKKGKVGGAFDAEVLTLNRLYYRVAEEAQTPSGKPLSRVGAVLTVRRILSELSKNSALKCYKSSAHKSGFSETVYDNLCQFAASGLSASDLSYDGNDVTALKIQDLKAVYAAYEKATEGKYIDSAGRMKLLEKLLDETELFNNTDVYFACYDDFTPMQRRVVDKICNKARAGGNTAIEINASCELKVRAKRLTQVSCKSRADEMKTAAAYIKELTGSGVRYGDIAVIAPKADFNRLKRIFDEYGVRFFTDCKYALSSHPLAKYLLDLFAAWEHGRNDDYIKLAHNPYSGISVLDADLFENYIASSALHEGAVKSKFTVTPAVPKSDNPYIDEKEREKAENIRKKAEKVRETVAEKVEELSKLQMGDGEQICAAIEKVLPKDDEEIAKRVDSDIAEAREKIIENAAILKEVFGGATEFPVMREALEDIFKMYSVSVLPNEADCVVVGDTSVFRAGGYKYLFVLSMHEGEVPAALHDDGMLSDREIGKINEELSKCGVKGKIEPKVEERNARSVNELYSVLSYAEGGIYVSYCDDCVPSSVISKLVADADKQNKAAKEEAKKRAKAEYEKIEIIETSREMMLGKLPDKDKESAEILKRLCPTEAAAYELYLLGRAEKNPKEEGYGYEDMIGCALLSTEYGCKRLNANGTLNYEERKAESKKARELYGERGISISRVQEYYACPFRGFSKYALGLNPRPTGEVTPLEIGNFLHAVIEKYFKASMKKDSSGAVTYDYTDSTVEESEADIKRKVENAVSEILPETQALNGANKIFVDALKLEAEKTIAVAVKQIESGNFRPEFIEGKFGNNIDVQKEDGKAECDSENPELNGYEITLEDGSKIMLKGKIDRLDVKPNGSRPLARVIDYKTGKEQLKLTDLYYGRKIQLPVYLKVVADANGYTPAGAFYFPFTSGFEESKNTHRLSGIFDEKYGADMDKVLEETGKTSDVVKATTNEGNTNFNRRCSCDAVTGDKLRAVCDYAEKVFTRGADEMLGGCCEPSPLTTNSKSECDYCEMKPLCTAYGSTVKKRRKKSVGSRTSSSADFIAECMAACSDCGGEDKERENK